MMDGVGLKIWLDNINGCDKWVTIEDGTNPMVIVGSHIYVHYECKYEIRTLIKIQMTLHYQTNIICPQMLLASHN